MRWRRLPRRGQAGVGLFDNGSHGWLTAIAPTSGDTHLGEGMGLHLIGDNLVYDAQTVPGEPRLWTTNVANGITPNSARP